MRIKSYFSLIREVLCPAKVDKKTLSKEQLMIVKANSKIKKELDVVNILKQLQLLKLMSKMLLEKSIYNILPKLNEKVISADYKS